MKTTKRKAKTKRKSNINPRRTTRRIIANEEKVIRFSKKMIEDLQQSTKSVLSELIRKFSQKGNDLDQQAIEQFSQDNFEMETINQIIEQIESQFLGFYSKEYIAGQLGPIFQRMSDIEASEIARQIGLNTLSIAPPELQAAIQMSVLTTANNLYANNQTILTNLRNEIAEGIRTGQRWETIAKKIERPISREKKLGDKPTSFRKGYNNAKFIARNEVGNAQGEINKQQQMAAGVRLYRWQTSRDERVRETHVRLGREKNNIYSWDGEVTIDGVTYYPAIDPAYSASATIPGQPWNCRCVAISYIPELE